MTELEMITASGAADVVGSGVAGVYQLRVSGAADVDLIDLVAPAVELDASGASDVAVFAAESASGIASGGSDVVVHGNPANVVIETTGASDVDIQN